METEKQTSRFSLEAKPFWFKSGLVCTVCLALFILNAWASCILSNQYLNAVIWEGVILAIIAIVSGTLSIVHYFEEQSTRRNRY